MEVPRPCLWQGSRESVSCITHQHTGRHDLRGERDYQLALLQKSKREIDNETFQSQQKNFELTCKCHLTPLAADHAQWRKICYDEANTQCWVRGNKKVFSILFCRKSGRQSFEKKIRKKILTLPKNLKAGTH